MTNSLPNPRWSEDYTKLQLIIDGMIAAEDILKMKLALFEITKEIEWLDLHYGTDYYLSSEDRQWRRYSIEAEKLTKSLLNLDGIEVIAKDNSSLIEAERFEVVSAINAELIHYLSKHPSCLHILKPRQFEFLIAEVLRSFGWQIEVTGSTRDGGYDIFGIAPLRGPANLQTTYIIECKKYAPKKIVGISAIRQLLHVKTEKNVANALLATTSEFSRDAYAVADRRYDLDLKNFNHIVDWCMNYTK